MGWFFRRKPQIVVLDSEPDDHSTMAEIHAASFPKPWSEEEIAALAGSPGVAVLCAREEGNGAAGPLGFLILRAAGDEAEVITVAVSPDLRRAGIGRALMEQAIRRAHADRLSRLMLEVGENNPAAIALYRSLGFRQVGERKGYYASHASRPVPADAPARGPTAPSALVMQLDLR